MQRSSVFGGLLLLVSATLSAQQTSAPIADPSGVLQPSELQPTPLSSVPLTYVGGDSRISLGIDENGDSQGDALHVFTSNAERALIGQLWWQDGGAGGLEIDFNWLLNANAIDLKAHPRKAAVAKLSLALDQNADNDRKATLGFGLERNDYFLNGYFSAAASGARITGSLIEQQVEILAGTDSIGRFTEDQTTTLSTPIQARPFRGGLGFRFGHFSDPWSLRTSAGLDYAYGAQGAEEWRGTLSLEKYLGQRGWSLAAQAEHAETATAFGEHRRDDRITLLLRYEFGGRGAFVAADQLDGPAAVRRALRTAVSSHPRTVESYQSRRGEPTRTTTVGPRQYQDRSPIAVDDAVVVATDSGGTQIAVLANDSDPEGQPLTLTSVSTPAHGSTSIVGNQVLYTPVAGFVGVDAFSYSVGDPSGLSATGQVSVTVQAGANNRPPTARDDGATTAADSAVDIDVLANDSDPDADPLTLTAVGTPLAGGTVAITADQRIRYTPAPGFSGTDQFAYTIGDGRGGTASAQVRVEVVTGNRAPIANDDGANTSQGSPVTIAVLANDSDPDSDPIRLISTTSPAFGSVVANADGTIRYSPDPAFSGTDSFIYTISDDRGGFASANVTVVVASVNAPPVAVDDNVSTPFVVGNIGQGVPVTIIVLDNDSDPNGDPLSVTSVTPAAFGAAVRNPDSTITYTPNPGFVGSDQFSYSISDGRGGSDSAVVNITVTAPNRAPVASDDLAATGSGVAVQINVLANDSDPDGDPLSVQSVSAANAGTAVINPDNTVTYTPATGFGGTDAFSYTISDGRGGTSSALVLIDVNIAPIAQNDNLAVGGSGPTRLAVLANDSDPNGDPLSIIAVGAPSLGSAVINPDNTITYTPGPNFLGADNFVYTISDGRGGSATATVNVFVVIP